MSITAWAIEARSVKDDDYGYVNIATTWKDKKMPIKPQNNRKIEAMWSHESVYGVIGSKVGDFIETYGLNSSLQEGIFTHRRIAEKLIKIFSGIKMNEIEWKENPLEHILKNGKPRLKRAKWLPEKEVDIVHIYSDVYIDVREPKPITTDFFTVIRKENSYENNWFMCTWQAKEKIGIMNYIEKIKQNERLEYSVGANDIEITYAEKELGVIFPIQYKNFLLECGMCNFGDSYINGISKYNNKTIYAIVEVTKYIRNEGNLSDDFIVLNFDAYEYLVLYKVSKKEKTEDGFIFGAEVHYDENQKMKIGKINKTYDSFKQYFEWFIT